MMERGREGGGERERNARGEESCKRERERVEVTWLSFFKKTQPGRIFFFSFFFVSKEFSSLTNDSLSGERRLSKKRFASLCLFSLSPFYLSLSARHRAPAHTAPSPPTRRARLLGQEGTRRKERKKESIEEVKRRRDSEMSGKNLASALQNFRQLAAKNQRIKVKSAEQWAKVREERGREERGRREEKRKWSH